MILSRRIAALAGLVLLGFGLAAPVASAQERRYNHAEGRWETIQPGQRRATQGQRLPAPEFRRVQVGFETREAPGTIIIDTERRYLFFVEPGGTATRYGVGVGKEGFGFSGNVKVARKAEWPGWTPPAQMRIRERAKGRELPAYMEGGPQNPLGARAMYLYRGGRDTLFRIHGTNQPWTIGQRMSSGCIRMTNEDVSHLYERVGLGAKVVVIGPDGRGRSSIYADAAPRRGGILSGLFGS